MTQLLDGGLTDLEVGAFTTAMRMTGESLDRQRDDAGDRCRLPELMCHTHPEFGRLMAEHAARSDGHVALMRGAEGEPVADPRRQLRQHIWIGSAANTG